MLEQPYFPMGMKDTLVLPLIMMKGLDTNDLKNFRPVSNLSFISKLFERTVHGRLLNHITTFNLLLKMQSAYQSNHSTETATLKVLNDLLLATDVGKVSAVCFLDLSVAFDTVDYLIMLDRLKLSFGVTDSALVWIESYLTGRSFRGLLGGQVSQEIDLLCDVPQGSVLGPLLFILYTADVARIADAH